MEISMVARSKKVSIDIPDDIAFSILSNMSIKSLKRFECVCKSWSLLFQNPYFMSLFRNNFLSNHCSSNDDTSLLLHQDVTIDSNKKFVLYSLSGERCENKTKLDWPNPFEEYEPDFDLSGSKSINGILCLLSYSQLNNIRVVLWNPTTEEFKVIPTSHNESIPCYNVDIDCHGFGYDCITDDYKVIRQVSCFPKNDFHIDWSSSKDTSSGHFWEIYSLRSNSWKILDFDIPVSYEDKTVFLDGVCHWWGENECITKDDYEVYLLSFDLSNEVFLITPILSEDYSLEVEFAWRDLAVLNGHVALISNYTKNNSFHISILGELGEKDSWIKLFIVEHVPCIEHPIGVGKKGEIFFRKKHRKLVYFNLSTHMIEELDFEGDNWSTVIYKESLLPIGGINI